jgi:chromosome segregation protein
VELQEELDQKSSALVDARQALELIRSGMAEALQQQELAERALATESTRLAALELEQREALRRQDELEREQGRQRIMAQRIAAESTEVEEALKNLDALVEERLDAARRARSEQVGLEQELQVEQAELLSEMKLLESARVDLNTKAAEAAALRERLVGLKRSESEVAELRDGSLSQIKAFENERQAAIARVQQLVDDDARLEKLLEEIGTGQGELSQRLTVGQEQLSTERSAMATKEQALRETLKAREAVTAERMELDRRVLRVRDEIERIRQQLEDRYQVSVAGMLDQMERSGHVIIEVDPAAIREDLPACARPGERDKKLIEEVRVVSSMLDDEASVNSWVERLQRAREEFERLGEVNLVALREYTEVAERHDSLEGQRKDLEDSVQAIRHSIGRLNRISRERFRETFDAVDTYFREIYPRLVGGGSARLELTDEEDLLETGVDIYVQPPGKRLQNLSLLSGGETAMVAIALIFSLFRVKPSPFCLLDEVDAPLDEGNGARFNSMLREMAQLSQFIVITHNKKTMECMDTLYGVTMPLPGVSRLVSVQLD